MRVTLRIHGHVQGVGFRWSTQRQGRSLGLTGWVRNCDDGTVECVAEGPDDAVNGFIAWCRKGPPGARVTDVEVGRQEGGEPFADFGIRH